MGNESIGPVIQMAAQEAAARAKMAEVVNLFYGTVDVGHLAGVSPTNRTERPQLSGKLSAAEVAVEQQYFIPPDGYEAAIEALSQDHVVVLCGAMGLGKRAGAINLLREVTDGRLVLLSTTNSLEDLSQRTYEPGWGYVIVNRKEADQGPEVELCWRTIRDRVRDKQAYLIVTTTDVDPSTDTVRHIVWRRPSVPSVLRAHLAAKPLRAADLALVAEAVTDDCSMTDLAAIARRLRSGEDPTQALETFSATSRRKVQEWFDHPPTRRQVFEVATLAFIQEPNKRTFEALLDRLTKAVEQRMFAPAGDANRQDVVDPNILPSGGDFTSEESLLKLERVQAGNTPRSTLRFRRPEFSKYVMHELWHRYDRRFWDGIHEWIETLVDGAEAPSAAVGLATLSDIDYDEVEHLYLVPWSKGSIGPAGQRAAVYVLWCMSVNEALAPAALDAAKRWANHGDPEQRWVAAMAYSGELGRRDPVGAIKQLWRLILQGGSGCENACVAMASLFALLTAEGTDAGSVLTHLQRQLDHPRQGAQEMPAGARALQVLMEVLTARDPRRGDSSIVQFLLQQPDRIDIVARLWAVAICNRPCRRLALEALWQGLNSLRRLSDRPLEAAQTFGEALARSLPDSELRELHRHLRVIDRRRSTSAHQQSLALIVLEAIERHLRTGHPQERS